MSRPPENENGTPSTPPNVYHPRPTTPPPVYEEFADPAAAHGWQNAYDATAELPSVTEEPAPGREEPRGHRAPGAGRGSRRKARVRSPRRILVAAGAVSVVSAAALMAGLSLFGSSSGDPQGGHDRTSPTSGEPVEPADSVGPGASKATDPSRTDTPAIGASPSASDGADDAEETPTAGPSATTGATPTATADTVAPGNSGENRGRGQGNTKGPK
ncbi:hypothetical protein ACQF36_08380 [Streptomyces sp. Marseille-Q5077]|uniref:hypothetical protein n=1 Tax=Streptomyces sp. Marseille-Q5077 TaxID=3418995 RepID=UPI003D088E0E